LSEITGIPTALISLTRHILAHQPLHGIEIVDHNVEDDIDIQRTIGKRRNAVDLKIERVGDVRPQCPHRGVEPLELAHHQLRPGTLARRDHFVRLFQRDRDRLFDQHMNARVEKRARYLAMRLRRRGDGDHIRLVQKFPPVRERRAAVLARDAVCRFGVNVARSDKLYPPLSGQLRVVACVVSAEASDADRRRP
jgi:hypothetical protein